MNSFGRLLRVQLFGESHGPAIGAVIDGVPAGLPIDLVAIEGRMAQRKSGSVRGTSNRKEDDLVEIQSGVFEGIATGAPLAYLIRNNDARPQDYESTQFVPRPGHADLTEHIWSRGKNDYRGGGHHSGRLTAPLVAAAAIMAPLHAAHGVSVDAKVVEVGGVSGSTREMEREIEKQRKAKDSVGGIIRFEAKGVPKSLGDPFADGLQARLAATLMSIPGAKGMSIGEGFGAASMLGSKHNDSYRMKDGNVAFNTNHAGGILGGRSTGEAIWGHVAFKPPSSIALPQQSINLRTGQEANVEVKGRHDACIAIRAAPVVRAAVELVLADAIMLATSQGHVAAPQWSD